MKLALAQMKMSDVVELNDKKSIAFIEQAAQQKADLILFPEIQLSPFFPQYRKKDVRKYTMKMNDPYIQKIQEACHNNHIYASPNFYVEEKGKHYDMSLLIDDQGKILGRQKMVHVAECPQFYEQDYYTPSEEGFSVFDTIFGKIGIVVCFDRHYPESIRTEALRGADLILIPTANTKAEPSELFQWEVRVQAFQNSVPIAMCNRTGKEGNMDFNGASLITDANGNLVSLAGETEELLIGEVNLAKTKRIRETKSYTSLRRKDLYE